MRLSRSLLPIAAALGIALAAAAPARAQGMDTILQVLVDVLAATAQSEGDGYQARRAYEAELDTIADERRRVIEDFDQHRREIKRAAKRSIQEIRDYVPRKRERRRRIRDVRDWRDRELQRLDEEEAWRLSDLDRRRDEAERRYDYRLGYSNYAPGTLQTGGYSPILDLLQPR